MRIPALEANAAGMSCVDAQVVPALPESSYAENKKG
jgi:hypothetical protein